MSERSLFHTGDSREFLSFKEASLWASNYLKKKVTVSNITYLVQYGRISKVQKNGNVLIPLEELKNYYDTLKSKEERLKERLGRNLNWKLSFTEYSEAERTKHVHRLHPYKGKFIPQLVEYFLDTHTDNFKQEVFFHPGDIVLDPFCGSGTTLVQANELQLNAIGIDVSFFNALIANVKVSKHDIVKLFNTIKKTTEDLERFPETKKSLFLEKELQEKLARFNEEFFPVPDFKIAVRKGELNEKEYGEEHAEKFRAIYEKLLEKYEMEVRQNKEETFLDRWFNAPIRKEIEFLASKIESVKDENVKNVLRIILSRTVRSCRATTHADLGTLKEPVFAPYYCKKHGKICKPLFSLKKWWKQYATDTLKRLSEFDKLRTDTRQICLVGDSRTINLSEELKKHNPILYRKMQKQKIAGIFTSPPYVGLIDYHEQHAYAYEIFRFPRQDEKEIGPLYKGQGKDARKSYVEAITQVLRNFKPYLKKDYNIFLVANDKYNLYPEIAALTKTKKT